MTEGVIHDLPDVDYHASPALSSSEARRLLDSPARYRYGKDNPRTDVSAAFDLGHTAHRLLLCRGAELEVIDAPDWRKADARDARDDARAAGRTPILAADHDRAADMASAFMAHPVAGRLLAEGDAEVSLFWTADGVDRRARFDWLPPVIQGRRLIVVDYKTATDASTAAFRRSAASYGYHQQAAWYLDAARAVLGAHAPAFLFAVQETTPPYLVNLVELDGMFLRIGAEMNRRAVEVFRDCTEAGIWPGYGDEVSHVSAPRWLEIEFENTYPTHHGGSW